ncbi:MAG: 30S ribosomal protein S5 [Candidatus Vogelbacteria bacterium]|nr:30S ribosomal protein S5 [Candidatus Vogelbacteria bacterium]
MDTKVLSIRRVARVIAGGKRFTFSVCLVLGDKKGSVGVGMAKAGGTSEAIEKATRDAKKNMIKINLTKSMSIPHETRAKYCSGVVDLRPAPGRGLIAGSAPRVVLALAGITDINAKIISGSKNKINNARATFAALKSLSE